MQQRGKQGSNISKQIAQFGKGLTAFSQHLDGDIAELKKAVASNPPAGRRNAAHLRGWFAICCDLWHTILLLGAEAQMQHCLHDMLHRATATDREVSRLDSVTVNTISLEVHLFAEHSNDVS